jgi:2-polyprenyl-3-methyl-5-hydroxy-6-metoxy-1,4-benzoquinol methylase
MKPPAVVGGDVSLVHHCYSECRPNYAPPSSQEALLAGRVPLFRRRYLPLLPIDREAAILDIGCGCGEFLYFLQREGFQNARGVDLDSRQVLQGQSLGVRNLEAGRAEDVLQHSVESFDSIVAIDVLEHMPKESVIEVLRLVRQALRTGGKLVCQVPNLAAFYQPLFYMDFTHETPFTASSLKQALQMAELSNVHVYPAGPLAHGLKSGLRAVLWRALSLGIRCVAAVEGGPQDRLNSIYTAAIIAVAEKV